MKRQDQSSRKIVIHRYHPSRMAKGYNPIKQLNNIIQQFNRYPIHTEYQQPHPRKEHHQTSIKSQQQLQNEGQQRSKNVLKRIIKNQLWNQLIDKQYQKNKIRLQSTSSNSIKRRTKTQGNPQYLSQNQSASDAKMRYKIFPHLLLQQNKILKSQKHYSNNNNNKIKDNKCQIFFQSFFPRGKSSIISKNIKNPSTNEAPRRILQNFKSKQLKWQQKSLITYEQTNQNLTVQL